MPLGATWYTLGEATSKYSLDTSSILKWADEGVVRSEQADTRSMQVNVDDLELKVHEITGI
jgi:hypothetical protein